MLSINKRKLIIGLSKKKQRVDSQLFKAEGVKLVRDLIEGGLEALFVVVEDSFALNPSDQDLFGNCEVIGCTAREMKEVSLLSTPSPVLGVFRIPKDEFSLSSAPDGLVLVLDEVQDPGNMGTILRVADWFGVRQVVCSNSCVDVFNPKVVQSTMGALARVRVTEIDLSEYLSLNEQKWGLPVYGTFLDGNNIYTQELSQCGFVAMGNEGKGISQEIGRFVTCKLLIPSFPVAEATSESLNVSTATAIVCSEFRRRAFV